MKRGLILSLIVLFSLSFVVAYTPDIFGHEMAEINWIASVCGVGEMMVGFLNTGVPNCQSSSISSLSASDGSPVDAVYVDADGDVGIGTTNPSAELDVQGSLVVDNLNDNGISALWVTRLGARNQGLKVYATDRSLYTRYVEDSGEPSPGTWRFINEKIGGNSYEFMIAQSNGDVSFNAGNVGIGTNNPHATLTVRDVNPLFSLSPSSTTFGSIMQIFTRDDDGDGEYDAIDNGWSFIARGDSYSVASQRNDLIISYVDNFVYNNALTIDSVTGDVGIGTTNPSEKLEVAGNIVASGSICDSGGCIGGSAKITSGTYLGDRTNNRPIAHNMGATPKLILITRVQGGNFHRIHEGLGKLFSQSSSGSYGNAYIYDVSLPNSNYFYVGNSDDWTYSGNYATSSGSPSTYLWVAFGE